MPVSKPLAHRSAAPLVSPPRVDFAAARARLATLRGREYWRSLEELTTSASFGEFVTQEFPRLASAWWDGIDRRQFLTLLGASLALAGLGGCDKPPNEPVMPYVHAPEGLTPGEPLFFASAWALEGVGSGILAKSNMGRPTKIEGNPDHPASLGATDLYAQASVLGLYDPDRQQVTTHLGEIRPWLSCVAAIRTTVEAQLQTGGAGLRILTGAITSPTLADQLRDLLRRFPQAKWHQFEPVGRDGARAGARLAFGEPVDVQYRFDQADVILALDADFLACGPGSLRYIRDYSARRRVETTDNTMSRLYAVECTPTNTGAKADHRLAVRPSEVDAIARALAAAVGVATATAPSGAHDDWIKAVAGDLRGARGRSIVLAGDQQPAALHVLAQAMNHVLGNLGRTVVCTDPVEAQPADQLRSLGELAQDMLRGAVQVLVILDVNAVYSAPSDFHFADALRQVPLRIHWGLYDDETAELCHWNVAATHYLETWSDVRAYDGTITIAQPLIAPLYEGRSAHEVLAAFSPQPDRSSYDIVRAYWQAHHAGPDFEQFWRKCLHDGVVPDTALPAKAVTFRSDAITALPPPSPAAPGLEIVFRPDPTVYDGRFANNAWLQELPKPLTRLTWDNAALIAPVTAERLQLNSGDVVELALGDVAVRAPVWVTPGHPADSITAHLGYGRRRAGRVGSDLGFDVAPLRRSTAWWAAAGLQLRRIGERYPLVTTQHHHDMEGRGLVREATLTEYRHDPAYVHAQPEHEGTDESLYPPYPYREAAWGMVIDLNACVGCGACVVACQAENNIPVVGKDQVSRGREMHWLRIDRYYKGELDHPRTYFQPVPCMQCENAPCELVCPVGATVHSHEGLNDMVYNRCVGTRYCSNNCPYKVRRFNFLQYSNWTVESLKLVQNPDVSVRSRGVMEKCTYCVQRIVAGRIAAEKENRRVRDGEVVTACAAACPAQAIVFGDINDAQSQVAQLKTEPRNYAILADLNTRPRTTYLGTLRNPNDGLVTSEGGEA